MPEPPSPGHVVGPGSETQEERVVDEPVEVKTAESEIKSHIGIVDIDA